MLWGMVKKKQTGHRWEVVSSRSTAEAAVATCRQGVALNADSSQAAVAWAQSMTAAAATVAGTAAAATAETVAEAAAAASVVVVAIVRSSYRRSHRSRGSLRPSSCCSSYPRH